MTKRRAAKNSANSRPATPVAVAAAACMPVTPSAPVPPVVRTVQSLLGKQPVAGLALFAIVLGVFLPTLRNDFICYDDNGYVTQNAWVQAGLTWANLAHAFRTTEIAYWHPLTWLSHLVDVQLFGLQPWGHHLTSVLWHAVNALLVFAVLRKLTGATGRSWVVAALFGLHPLHVESVAWVAERKDVLSTFFSLVAIWFYAEWVARRAAGHRRATVSYAFSLLAFAAGIMSKPMVVTLPCVLLLLDYWPLGRLRGESTLSVATWSKFGRLFVEKLPFFALSAVACVVTIRAQASLGTLQTITQYSLSTRVLNALLAYAGYLEKCFWPSKLAVFYPYQATPSVGLGVAAGVYLTVVTVLVVVGAKRRPYLPVGWFWFLGTLVPVIGLVQVGGQAMADRYTYVPLIGVFLVVVWGMADVAKRWALRPAMVWSATTAVLVMLGGLTVRQVGLWRDNPTLFGHALAVTEGNWCAHFCLGNHYAQSPEHRERAIAEYRATVALTPMAAEAHHSLAAMLVRHPSGVAEAIAEFEAALRLNPRLTEAHTGLGQALLRVSGRGDEALKEFAAAMRLDPANVEVRINLGHALTVLPGRLPEAVAELRSAVRLAPDSAAAHHHLGVALALTPGGLAGAVTEFQAALRIDPRHARAQLALGEALERLPGRGAEAVAAYEAALRIEPDNADAHLRLADALAGQSGRAGEAIAEYQAVLRLRPDWVEVHNNLGVVLASLPGRLTEAIAEYDAVLRVKPTFVEAHSNRANALARIPGRESEALAAYETAVRLQPDDFRVQFNFGQFLLRFVGREREAAAHFEAALKSKPDLEEARQILARLRASGRM